ncbi:hypothetical protein PoB_001045900 [Plakobranchus ocellatus]|uniref:Uncharacterized protein n=1 Tax=Plakobranchus ocellatus TaxID=259542 RepID=A0AAV3YLP9_9GAST|nr:hypothetical protein PoB_001045900 [Plakobranchus ocellatus]
MYWQLVQIAAYYKVISGFKALVKCARSFQAGTTDRKVSADIRASSLAIEPPAPHSSGSAPNRNDMQNYLVQFCDHETRVSPTLYCCQQA